MNKEANVDAAGCGGRSPPQDDTKRDKDNATDLIPAKSDAIHIAETLRDHATNIEKTVGPLKRAQWLDLFFKNFRGPKATVLGFDCCELVKILGLDRVSQACQSF